MLVDRRTNVCETALSLAGPVVAALQNETCPESGHQAVHAMYRLLLGYRSHGFQGLSDTSEEKNFEALKQAFDTAFSDIFPGEPVAAAVNRMKPVLKNLLDPETIKDPDPDDRDLATAFFQRLVVTLSADPSNPEFQA